MAIVFTGDPAIDLPKFDDLNDEDILNIFTINGTYNTDQFWTRRLEIKFPGAPHFLGAMEVANFYIRLLEIGNAFSKEQQVRSILNNELNVLQYYYDKSPFPIDTILTDAAASTGNIPMLAWLGKFPTLNGINAAARNNYYDFIVFVNEKYDLRPDIFQAALSNNTDMIDYLIRYEDRVDCRYINSDIIPRMTGKMFRYLLDSGFRVQKSTAANMLAIAGEFALLKILHEKRGTKPEPGALAKALKNGHFTIVAWAADLQVYPNPADMLPRVSPADACRFSPSNVKDLDMSQSM